MHVALKIQKDKQDYADETCPPNGKRRWAGFIRMSVLNVTLAWNHLSGIRQNVAFRNIITDASLNKGRMNCAAGHGEAGFLRQCQFQGNLYQIYGPYLFSHSSGLKYGRTITEKAARSDGETKTH